MGKTVGCGCDYCTSNGVRRDFRHGGVDLNDFEEAYPYRKNKHKSYGKKKTPRPPRGCPGNDGKAHVWVWTTFLEVYGWEARYFADDREYRVCCGCGKRPRTKSSRRKVR